MQSTSKSNISRPCAAGGQEAGLVELRKQVSARLHLGRNVSLDMIQEYCLSLHHGPAYERHAGTTSLGSDHETDTEAQ